MNYVDLLVTAFILLHGAAFISVMIWIGRFLVVRNQIGDAQEAAREKERKARIPALAFSILLAASYVAIFILEATLSKQ